MFQGDIGRAAMLLEHDPPSQQTFNPVFRAQAARYGQLDLGSSTSSWQLQGLAANSRTTAQEMSALAWSQSTSSNSLNVVPHTAQTDAQTSSDDFPTEAVSMAQLLADDRQDSAEWVSSSSSSEEMVPPLRSLSFPNAALVGAYRQEEAVRSRRLGSDTSLPVSVQSAFHDQLWSAGHQQSPGLTLRQRFMQEQRQGAEALPPDQAGPEQPDIWAALERQPSPVITLRQRFGQAQQQQPQQDTQRQESGMQSSQAVLELSPEDIMLQEASPGQEQAAPQASCSALCAQEPGISMVHQQSGLQPQLDGVSARSVARQLSHLGKSSTAGFSDSTEAVYEANRKVGRRLSKLSSAMSSGPAFDAGELANKGVHFGSAAGHEQEQRSFQQAPWRTGLPRAKSSLKQTRPPPGSLKRRSFRRSSVSFAAVSTASESGSDVSDVSDIGKSKAVVNAAAAPLMKTVSSVWAMITGGGPTSSAAIAAYAPTRTESRGYEDTPTAQPSRPPPMAASRWQNASKKAAAAARSTPVKRPLSRFGSFFDIVAQETAAHGRPSLSRRLGQEHVELGVRMLLEARENGSKLESLTSEQGSGLQHQASLAKVMQVLSAKHMSKMTSMVPISQVRASKPQILSDLETFDMISVHP